MSFAQLLSSYITLNFLIILGFLGLQGFSFWLRKFKYRNEAVCELKLHYAVLLTIIGLMAIHPIIPSEKIFNPALKVWSAPSLKSFSSDSNKLDSGGYLIFPNNGEFSPVQADQVAILWFALASLLLTMGSCYLYRDIRRLIKIKRESFLVKRVGKVSVLVNHEIEVPFSYWLPGQANILIPIHLIDDRQEYRIAIAHEIQHHRHGDTRWVYVMWGLKLTCFINPAVHFWNYWISEIQEFACDETLVDRKKVESQAYARCLVKVAQTAIELKHVPACATGFTFLFEGNLLKRRIERMFSTSTTKIQRSLSTAVGVLLASTMAVAAYASKGLVQDRRVSMAMAEKMAIRAQSNTGFPIVVNDRVLKQLNRYIGTPEGREFMRNALARMDNYKILVDEKIRKYSLPEELMAMPLIESGYQNLPESKNSAWPNWKAAGLWQFIRETARNYGLTINEKRDDRLNVELLTDAAMRYLHSNYLRFQDWQLATLAYNMGENAVQKGMDSLGTRDAWVLIRNGYEGDKGYLAKLMAAILIMRNPESVE